MPDPDTALEPSPQTLQESIRDRRDDLVRHVHELENIVRAKLDFKARARRAAERFLAAFRARPIPYVLVGSVVVMLLLRRR